MLNTLVYFVIYLIVAGCIIGLLLWLIDVIPIPEPFHRIARIAIIVIGVLIVIMLLLSLVGEGPGRFRIGETNGQVNESPDHRHQSTAWRHEGAAGVQDGRQFYPSHFTG
jgi:cytochrome c biogenesis protein CcdA